MRQTKAAGLGSPHGTTGRALHDENASFASWAIDVIASCPLPFPVPNRTVHEEFQMATATAQPTASEGTDVPWGWMVALLLRLQLTSFFSHGPLA